MSRTALLALVAALLSPGPGRAASPVGAPSDGAPWISLAPAVAVDGAAGASGVILSAAAADVDGDGVVDLLLGAEAGSAGQVLVLHGDPRIPDAASPFPGPPVAAAIPFRPDVLAAGDVDGDGRADVLGAERGSRVLTVLPGAPGALGPPVAASLPGPLEHLAAGDWGRRDGIDDVAVALGGAAPRVLLFAPLPSPPRELVAPGRVSALAFGDTDGDGLVDLVVAGAGGVVATGPAGSRALVAAPTAAMALGDYGPGPGQEPALLMPGEGIAAGEGLVVAGRRLDVPAPADAILARVKVSSVPGDDLVVAHPDGRLEILNVAPDGRPAGTTPESRAPRLVTAERRGRPGVVAVLPLRLNADALTDLVVVSGTGADLHLTTPRATFTVTNVNNSGAGSLRAAITAANGAAGADDIVFSIGVGIRTISPTSALPAVTGVTLVNGATQGGYAGLPLIQLNGTGAGAASSGLVLTGPTCTVRALAINRFNQRGIDITGAGAIVEGSHVGVDPAGTTPLPNLGVGIQAAGGGHTIGGTGANAMNVISANDAAGVRITGGSGSTVLGNRIGTDRAGTTDLGNTGAAVLLDGSTSGNTVGGTTVAARNVISGSGFGVHVLSGTLNLVQGNFIGLDATGLVGMGNDQPGVTLEDADNTVGGTTAAARNVISNNLIYGVFLNAAGATGNLVQGNYIGTDSLGTTAIANGFAGVALVNAPGNTIGGTVSGARNVVSGNEWGIFLNDVGTTGNLIQGNYVGTTPSGAAALPNLFDGVFIQAGATGNTVGGTVANARNVISGNGGSGVFLLSPGTDLNVIQGNFIGTDAAGTGDLGNAFAGITLWDGSSNVIGGPSLAERNVISGNDTTGIEIAGTAVGNDLQGNVIGLGAGGGAMGNASHGIYLAATSTGTLIGGATAASANVIARNGGDGVFVEDGSGHDVGANSIFQNDGLAIDLAPDGVTPNDVQDPDPGPNGLQNHPVLATALFGGLSTTYSGTLNSTPSTTFTIRVYGNAAPDPSGRGEAQTYVGSTTATTNAAGNANWSLVALGSASFPAATATSPSGSTSELSPFFSNPQEASPSSDMTAAKGLGSTVAIAYSPACGATDHAVYSGTSPIAGALAWTSSTCARGITGATGFDPGTPAAGTFRYFVIVGGNGTREGSYGQDSGGAERPEAAGIGACDLPLSTISPCPP